MGWNCWTFSKLQTKWTLKFNPLNLIEHVLVEIGRFLIVKSITSFRFGELITSLKLMYTSSFSLSALLFFLNLIPQILFPIFVSVLSDYVLSYSIRVCIFLIDVLLGVRSIPQWDGARVVLLFVVTDDRWSIEVNRKRRCVLCSSVAMKKKWIKPRLECFTNDSYQCL